MESSAGANPLGAFLGFWMLIQLVVVLGLLLGGLYALFCLHRTASNLDRLASAVEDLVARSATSNVDSPTYRAPVAGFAAQSTLATPEADLAQPNSPQPMGDVTGETRPV